MFTTTNNEGDVDFTEESSVIIDTMENCQESGTGAENSRHLPLKKVCPMLCFNHFMKLNHIHNTW